jgi:hypothetical protein
MRFALKNFSPQVSPNRKLIHCYDTLMCNSGFCYRNMDDALIPIDLWNRVIETVYGPDFVPVCRSVHIQMMGGIFAIITCLHFSS